MVPARCQALIRRQFSIGDFGVLVSAQHVFMQGEDGQGNFRSERGWREGRRNNWHNWFWFDREKKRFRRCCRNITSENVFRA